MNKIEILKKLPYAEPFLFVDELLDIHSEGAVGKFTFKRDMNFYRGHFKEVPITPGVILTECCAQIGLVCLGIFLLGKDIDETPLQIGMSSSDMEFYIPIYPGETVRVESEKVYFRFGKLKCRVKLFNQAGELACKGVLAGMLKSERNGK
ncbi:3-hydroxyacyl-ACP dehydratase FabZ family protein [Flagellimonas meridianipacifica]|uniref:3-hydroxyacyl-[acyl-carrier-protein] dehydratase n=1 Tax=Flagellimonas meridianipacifica TaxID=1080225 RepID=A0A2T0MBE2_9FLAO|nr:FabA/FabZ family ACP-dehydratase [Allomuricauda pacifica]PRX54816.1 3-hydroxyacyl-[acyl-carrier-protein] dehydratase [Allomuricauda pacifica]